jgi:hypothetical protein
MRWPCGAGQQPPGRCDWDRKRVSGRPISSRPAIKTGPRRATARTVAEPATMRSVSTTIACVPTEPPRLRLCMRYQDAHGESRRRFDKPSHVRSPQSSSNRPPLACPLVGPGHPNEGQVPPRVKLERAIHGLTTMSRLGRWPLALRASSHRPVRRTVPTGFKIAAPRRGGTPLAGIRGVHRRGVELLAAVCGGIEFGRGFLAAVGAPVLPGDVGLRIRACESTLRRRFHRGPVRIETSLGNGCQR